MPNYLNRFLLNSASSFPMTVNDTSLPSYINYTTEKRLCTVAVLVEDISKIIQNLDSNNSHGDDNLSICMLKLCGASICKQLDINFRQALLTVMFSSERRKRIMLLFTKKVTSKILKIIVQFP